MGHYHLQFAVLLPLIVDALLRLVTGRGRPVRTGAWLGLLTAAQLFIAEETVALTGVAGVVIVVVLAVSRPRAVAGLVRGTVTGLAAAAGVLLVTAGYPLWVQFHGPLAEQGSPWKPGHFRNRPGDFVNGPSGVLLHSQATVAYLSQHAVRMVEYFAYLGWPMLVVLLLAAVCFWRDLRVRALAVTFVVLEVFSLGSRTVVVRGLHIPATLMPWHYLQGLPLLEPEPAQPVLAAGGRRGRGDPGVLPGPGVGTGCLGTGRPGGCPAADSRGGPGGGGPGRPGQPVPRPPQRPRPAAAAPAADRRTGPGSRPGVRPPPWPSSPWLSCPSSRSPCRRRRSSRPRQAGSRLSPGCGWPATRGCWSSRSSPPP